MRATQVLFRRIRQFQLTTKQGPKDYYKGTGSGRMGDHTKYGGYIVNYDRVRTYVVPQGLDSFKVRQGGETWILGHPAGANAGGS